MNVRPNVERIRACIDYSGLSQGKISALSGVSREQINKIARGKLEHVHLSTVRALAATFAVPFLELVEQ